MRLFKRKSLKAGYCNISEPVSDLDPKRISAIKAKTSQHITDHVDYGNGNSHSINKDKEEDKENDKSSVNVGLNVAKGQGSKNDETFITSETITLDTSPSAESSRNKGVLQQQQSYSNLNSSTYPSTSSSSPESNDRKRLEHQQQYHQYHQLSPPEPPIDIASPNTSDAKLLLESSPDSSRPGTMFPVSSASASASIAASASLSASKVMDATNMSITNTTVTGTGTATNTNKTSSPTTMLMPKTPETFFEGKNRKRIEMKLDSMSHTSHDAPTEYPIAPSGIATIPTKSKGRTKLKAKSIIKKSTIKALTGKGKGGIHHITASPSKEENNGADGAGVIVTGHGKGHGHVRLTQTKGAGPSDTTGGGKHSHPNAHLAHPHKRDNGNNDSDSQTSDLDKSFSPQIVSVNSDITDPSYGMSSSRHKRQQQQHGSNNAATSWKKFRKLRRYFNETFQSQSKSKGASSTSRGNNKNLNSKAGAGTGGNGEPAQKQGPLSLLDMIIDAICSHPVDKS